RREEPGSACAASASETVDRHRRDALERAVLELRALLEHPPPLRDHQHGLPLLPERAEMPHQLLERIERQLFAPSRDHLRRALVTTSTDDGSSRCALRGPTSYSSDSSVGFTRRRAIISASNSGP